MTLSQFASLFSALWPIVEPFGEDAFQFIETLISGSRAKVATLPPAPIAAQVSGELDAAKAKLDGG